MKVFLTGAAGFIGFHTARALLDKGATVLGYDNLSNYYDPSYKLARLEILRSYSLFTFVKGDLRDVDALTKQWKSFKPSHVIHLAAQPAVRYSVKNPTPYIGTNIVGFQNVIDLVQSFKPDNFIYASSSSVYGGNKQIPFKEDHETKNPLNLYAATKISNELVASAYGNLHGINSTGLRFFTVYGPYDRPDMAMFNFSEKIHSGESIQVYNHGNMVRDFTYIADIVNGILRALEKPEHNQIYNLGAGRPEKLLTMIGQLESCLGCEAQLDFVPMQAGEMKFTFADITKAKERLGYYPKTDLRTGISRYSEWFLSTRLQPRITMPPKLREDAYSPNIPKLPHRLPQHDYPH